MDDSEHSPGWRVANRALWLLGTAVVAAHAVALILYGPGALAAAEQAAQQQIISEHGLLCDELGIGTIGARREQCLNLLLQLQRRHEQSFSARTSGLF
jgi:hypothetical protein